MTKKKWTEKREDCPCIDFYAGEVFCQAQNDNDCIYQTCPFVFWMKTDREKIIESCFGGIEPEAKNPAT